uniref:Uncharacterized protein n=1 Tax=Rhizophora mucronata TaxID=61149 RepID=A0A2P2N0W3_RHIMU
MCYWSNSSKRQHLLVASWWTGSFLAFETQKVIGS